MSIQTVEIALPTGIDSVSVGLAEPISIVEVRQGPAGPAGSAVIDAATQSDGTAALYLDSIRFEATNGGPTQLGEMAWESNDGSIDAMLESGVIVAMGEDLVIRVRNTTASPITKGTALAYDGTSGASGRIEVKPWVGANIPTAKLFLGFAACDMPANSNGYSQWFGKLTEINTSGGGQTWLDEQIIYAVPGASAMLTNVAPTSGEYAAAAVVINAGSGTSGILFVRPTFEVASSTSATANTLVLRDANGGASFAGVTLSGINTNSGSYSQVGGANFNVATTTAANLTATGSGTVTVSGEGGTTISGGTLTFSPSGFAYGAGAAAAHRTALGLGTGDSPTFAGLNAVGNGVTTTTIGADGRQSWFFNNSGVAAGQISYSSPGGEPGIVIIKGTGRSDIRAVSGMGIAIASYSSGSGAPAEQFRFSLAGNMLVGTTSETGLTSGGLRTSGNAIIGGTLSVTGASTFGGLIEQRNGSAAQESRIYGTYTGATNFERLILKYNAADTAFQIGTEKGSAGGVAQPLQFRTDSTTRMAITTAGNVGIGTTSPASKLTVTGGDIEVTDSASGIILKSPNGTRYRVTVSDLGVLSAASL